MQKWDPWYNLRKRNRRERGISMMESPLAFLAGEKETSSGPVRRTLEFALFDLDGTLIDSEDNHYESDRILLSRRGISFSREDKAAYVGKDIYEMVRRIRANYGLEDDVQALVDEKNALYRKIALTSSRLYPPMQPLLEGLAERGLPMAVATGSNSTIASEILDVLGVRSFFTHIVSSSEVRRGKPEPDIFLEAARRMNRAPEASVVFEDTKYGVEAALNAGMTCVALPAPGERTDDPLFRKASYLVSGGPDALDTGDFFRWLDPLL